MVRAGLKGGLEVVVHVVHVVGSVPVAHPVVSVPVAAVSPVGVAPVGVAVGAVPGVGISLGSSQGGKTDLSMRRVEGEVMILLLLATHHDGNLDHSSSIADN